MSKIEMGKTYKTRNGEAVRVLCLDSGHPVYPVVAVVCNEYDNHNVRIFTPDGKFFVSGESEYDLSEYSPWRDVAVDTKVLVFDRQKDMWVPMHFARPDLESGFGAYTWVDGATSFTSERMRYWEFAKLA